MMEYRAIERANIEMIKELYKYNKNKVRTLNVESTEYKTPK